MPPPTPKPIVFRNPSHNPQSARKTVIFVLFVESLTYDIKISQITKLKGTKSHKARRSFLVAHPGASEAPPAHLPLHTIPHAVAPWADVADPFRQRHRARPCDTGHSGLRTRTLEFGFGPSIATVLGSCAAPGPERDSGTGAPPCM